MLIQETDMVERPILFNGEMVRALIEGRKTQTRRPVNPQPPRWKWSINKWDGRCVNVTMDDGREYWVKSPYGAPGDLLWVRETWRAWFPTREDGQPVDDSWHVRYRADGRERVCNATWDEGDGYTSPEELSLDTEPNKWRPSIHMPRWASRISLAVTDVRAERVQDIREECFQYEGIEHYLGWHDMESGIFYPGAHFFIRLWDSINAKRGYSWESNPWVWVVTFEVAQ